MNFGRPTDDGVEPESVAESGSQRCYLSLELLRFGLGGPEPLLVFGEPLVLDRKHERGRDRGADLHVALVVPVRPMRLAIWRQADACTSVYIPAVAFMTTSAPLTWPPANRGTASLARSPDSRSFARQMVASSNRLSVAMSAMTCVSPSNADASAKLSVATRPPRSKVVAYRLLSLRRLRRSAYSAKREYVCPSSSRSAMSM